MSKPHRPDIWHTPAPGPEYWSYRCLICDRDVGAHPPFWARLKHKIKQRRNRKARR